MAASDSNRKGALMISTGQTACPHCKEIFSVSLDSKQSKDVLVRREDAARLAELVNDSIRDKGKFATAILMMPPYPAPDCPLCGYAIDNEGLCVLDAAHTGVEEDG